MDTESGRIYHPDEYADRRERRIADKYQEAFERRFAEGEIVEVSEAVAQLVETGQRANERRRKRKAAKAARRRNRS